MIKDVECASLCSVSVNEKEFAQIKRMVETEYETEWYGLDGLCEIEGFWMD